jgi:hypothetical protein
MVTVLGVLLPIAFAAGIAARKSAPTIAALPAALTTTPQHFEAVEWERADLFTKTPIRVRLVRESSGAGRFAVELSAAKDFVKPDLIVYWIAGNPNLTDTLPDNARLLGGFEAKALQLPGEAGETNGVLVLFSLANGEVVDVSQPTRFNGSTK